MGRRAEVNVADINAAHWTGAGTNYIVKANNGSYYMFYIDASADVSYKKSSDGVTWSNATLAATAGTTIQLAVWYDRWSNIAADRIHFAFTDSGNDDIFYRTLDTSSDSLSTQITIIATWASLTGPGGHLSITRAVGGNVYVKCVGDAGVEGGFYRLPNANVPNGAWDAARTIDETLATLDQIILQPDFDAADTQDIMAIFQDASVTETSRKLYDDSANTWGETSINAAITELSTATAVFNFAAAPDISNTSSVLVVWTATDTLNADLLCYTVDSGAITAKTDVVTNSTDDQGLCAIGIATDTGYWHVFYFGITTGGETWNTSLNLYTRVSRDSGSTWDPETKLTTQAWGTIRYLYCSPRFTGEPLVAFVVDAQTDDLKVVARIQQPRASLNLGV